jgi:hypothetical protein
VRAWLRSKWEAAPLWAQLTVLLIVAPAMPVILAFMLLVVVLSTPFLMAEELLDRLVGIKQKNSVDQNADLD